MLSRLLFILFLTTNTLFATLHVDVQATSAILINADTGKVLFSKNATKSMYPASCTKIAYALYAMKFHESLFNKKIICSQNALKSMSEAQKSKNNFANVPSYVLETDASHMGLKVGEEMRFYDLLEGTMIVSADDASNVMAEVMGGGSIQKCVDDVNRFIASLGCKNTHFTNPHGLHHPEHVTTAADLALLCQEAMRVPLFRKMAKTVRYERPKTNKQSPVFLQQTNRLLIKGNTYYYPPCVGIKTGYHRRAGHCLTAQAEKNGRSLISVVLQSTREDRFKDTKKLFETAFAETKIERTILPAGPQTFSRHIKGAKNVLTTHTQDPLSLHYYPSEEPKFRCELVWHAVELPLTNDSIVGELLLYADGAKVQQVHLYATTSIDATWAHAISLHLTPWLLASLAGFLGLLIILWMRRRA